MENKFSLPKDLYPYQIEDSEKMLSIGNWLNFSEMGVGKTPEALNVVEQGNFQIPLIICPNSLRLEWKRQIEDWVGPDNCAVGDGYLKVGPIIRSLKEGQKYKILNYEALRKEEILDILQYIPFDVIIFDEIHKLRNPKTKLVEGASKDRWEREERQGGVWKFLNQHPEAKIIGLSGSPIMNYPNDLYVPLSVVNPEKYPRAITPWRHFMYKYCLWSDGRYGPYMYGTRNLERLREETSPFIIRRTKKEVLPFLPDKYYRRAMLEMQPDQRKLYDQMERELKILLDTGEPLWSTNVLSCLTRLRQINLDPKIVGVTSSSAKTEFIMDTIESTDGKLVIFSCFEKYIYLLHLMLEGTPHSMITGQVPANQRQEEVKKFQEDDKVKLCLGTIQAMGEGITLTASSNVILADRWWNRPVCDQAVDRLHRIGQKNAVMVIYPICEDSVDATLDQILERKYTASQSYYSETEVRQTVLGGL